MQISTALSEPMTAICTPILTLQSRRSKCRIDNQDRSSSMSLLSVISQIKHLPRRVERCFDMNHIPFRQFFLWAIQGELLDPVHSIMNGDDSMRAVISSTDGDLVRS